MVVKLPGRRTRKTRNLSPIVQVVPSSQLYNSANVPQGSPFGGGALTSYNGADTITYATRKSTERWRSNWCEHNRYEQVRYTGNPLVPYTVYDLNPSHPGWYTKYYQGHLHSALAHNTAVTAGLSALGVSIVGDRFYPGDPQADYDGNFYRLHPDLTSLSLPNFLWELDDVEKLYEQFKNNLKVLQDLLPAYKYLYRNYSARRVASEYLGYKFGYAPTLGDLTSMTSGLKGLFEKIRALEAACGKFHHQKFSFDRDEKAYTGQFNYQGDVKQPCSWVARKSSVKVCGSTYRLEPFQVTGDYKKEILAILDALGFENNPRIVWDALPFTFVIDWFFGVGSWLESHKTDTLEIPVSFRDGFTSYREEWSIESWLTLDKGSTISSPSSWPSWRTSRRYYTRIPCYPSNDTLRGLGWRLPTLNQATLLVALATVLNPIRRL